MKVDKEVCVSCGMCAGGFNGDRKCPTNALRFNPIDGVRIDTTLCIGCGLCASLCALGAIGE